MSDSAEKKVEVVLRDILLRDSTLETVGIRYHDEDTANASPLVKVAAIKGEQVLEGPGGYMFEGRIELSSNEPDEAQLTDLIARIDSQIESGDDTDVAGLSEFTFFDIQEDTSGDRTSESDTRTRVRSFPIHAVFAA